MSEKYGEKQLEELAGISTALDVLVNALARCRDEDMRTPKVFAALDFLEARGAAKWPFEQFRKSPGHRQPRRPLAKPQRIAQWHQAVGEF